MFDTMEVQIRSPYNNEVIAHLTTLSNLNQTGGNWVRSRNYNVLEFKGQTIRLVFIVQNDSLYPSSFRVDTTALMVATEPPEVLSSTRIDPDPTSAATVRFRITFSEHVRGVDTADFRLSTSGISGAAVTDVSGSGAEYIITVATGKGAGALRLEVPESASVTDVEGNDLSGLPFVNGETYTLKRYFTHIPLVVR